MKSLEMNRLAEKLRVMIEQFPFTANQAKKLHLTTSIGVALHNGHPDYSRIISRADEALYQAKASDRNTVVIAP